MTGRRPNAKLEPLTSLTVSGNGINPFSEMVIGNNTARGMIITQRHEITDGH